MPLPTQPTAPGSQSNTTITIGGTNAGNGPLPQGTWGAANRAYVRQVQPDQLVQNQLTGLLAGDSQYIQQARNQAGRNAASRGLLNSSIASGAGQAAAIQAGLPIAQADAQTYFQTEAQNQADLNAQQLAIERNDASLEGARIGAGAQIEGANIAANSALQRQRENLAYAGEQEALGRAFTENMAQFDHLRQLGIMEAGFGYDIGRTGFGADMSMRVDNNAFGNNMTMAQQMQRFNQQNMMAGMMIDLTQMGYQSSMQNNSILMSALLNNPEYLQNPAGVQGLANMFHNLFAPENPNAIGNQLIPMLGSIFGIGGGGPRRGARGPGG